MDNALCGRYNSIIKEMEPKLVPRIREETKPMKIAFDVDVLAKQMSINDMVHQVADWGY